MSCSRIVIIHQVNTDPHNKFSAIKLEDLSVKTHAELVTAFFFALSRFGLWIYALPKATGRDGDLKDTKRPNSCLKVQRDL